MDTLETEANKGDKTQIIEDEPKMAEKTTKLIVLFVVITCMVSLVALIIAIVGVAGNGTGTNPGFSNSQAANNQNEVYINSGGSGNSNGDKIWMFQIGHFGANTQYLDETRGIIRGYDVDVVNAVCQVANKNCRLVWDLYERCWDSQAGQRGRGGEGLMGNWYDACIGWYPTLDRGRTFAFSNPLEQGYEVAFYVKTGGSFNWPEFAGLNVGFLDGWWIDEHCLARYSPTGFDSENVEQVIHYQTEQAAVDALVSGEIDVAFMPVVTFLTFNDDVTMAYTPDTDKCANGGPSLMMAQDQTELLSWWNAALDRLIATKQYTDICDDVTSEHGDQPGDAPEDICLV